MNIETILIRKFPGTAWVIIGEDYAGLDWRDDSPKPIEKTLESLWPIVQYEVAYEQVEQARQVAYRETSDPLFFQVQRGEATEQEWLDAVQAVKTANPYPKQPKK